MFPDESAAVYPLPIADVVIRARRAELLADIASAEARLAEGVPLDERYKLEAQRDLRRSEVDSLDEVLRIRAGSPLNVPHKQVRPC